MFQECIPAMFTNTILGEKMEMTLQELLDLVKENHGEGVDPSQVVINISWEQFEGFGHDAYDANDYRIEISTEVKS